MPSFGLGVSDATLPRNVSASGGPSFSYDLRTWALQAGSAFQPGRGNDYFWTRVYFAGGSSSSSCYWSFPILYDDDFWPGPSSGSYAPYQPVPAAMSGLHGAYLRNALLRAGVLTPEEVTPEHPHIRTSLMQYVPLQWFAAAGGTTSSVQPLLFPLFTLFLLPPLAYPVGAEKRDRLYSMISMSGGRRAPYIAAHYAFSVIMFLGVALVYMVAGYVSGAASFTNTGPALLTALMLTWAHAQAGWALLLGAGLPSPRAATILAYLAVVCVAVANFLCTMFLSPWPTSLTWVPVLSYARAATLILSYGGAWVTDGSETQLALLVTLLQGTLALGLGAYLHAVVPGPDGTGTAESWLAPLEPAWRLLRRALGKRDDHHEIHDWAAGAPPSSGSADPDVRAEEARVAAGGSRLAASSAIYLSSVVKEFRVRGGKARQAVRALPPDAGALSRWWARLSANAQEWAWDIAAALMLRPAGASSPSHHVLKRAVDNLSLAVPRGQTLGLLGPNGAGKSTTISMLVGQLSPGPRGALFVEGYDVRGDMASVWRTLGVTPQFDAVWEDLTVREHLSFYAHLKGVPSRRVKAEVQQVAERCALDGDQFDSLAKRLSGGERRRLSLGIALLGGPPLIVLDEPSTGLDAAARREMWRIIQAEKAAGKTIIITTHAMEEADALADRIAIVCRGKLHAIGSQLRLKARYGDGYQLTLTLAVDQRAPTPEAAANRAIAFVRSSITAGARLQSRVGLTATFLLPRVDKASGALLDVADVFETLESHRGAGVFVESGLGQSSLDQVFISVVEAAEAAHNE